MDDPAEATDETHIDEPDGGWTQRWRRRLETLRGRLATPRVENQEATPRRESAPPSAVERAEELLSQGHGYEAERLLRDEVARQPDSGDGWLLLATLAEERHELAETIGCYERACWALAGRPAPLRARLHRRLGELHRDAGRADRAVRELRKALALAPQELATVALLGEALAAQGESEGAEHMWQRLHRGLIAPEQRGVDESSSSEGESLPAAVPRGLLCWAKRATELDDLWLAADLLTRAEALIAKLAQPDARDRGTSGEQGAERLARQLQWTKLELALAQDDVDEVAHQAGSLLNLAPDGPAPRGDAPTFDQDEPRMELVAVALAAALRRGERALAQRLSAELLRLYPLHPLHAVALAWTGGEPSDGAWREVLDSRMAKASPLQAQLPSCTDLAPGERFVRASRPFWARESLGAALDTARRSHRWTEVEQLARLAAAQARAPLRALDGARPAHRPPTGAPSIDTPSVVRPDERPFQALAQALAHQRLAKLGEPLVALRSVAAELATVADFGNVGVRLLQATDELEALRARPLTLGVLGEFNSGKSTLVNALVGRELLPTSRLPMTGCAHYLRWGPAVFAQLARRGGERIELAPERLREQLQALDQTEADSVEIELPVAALEGFVLVDTPGLNSIDQSHERRAHELLPSLDGAIWLFRARQPATDSEREQIEALHRTGLPLLGVVNGLDVLDGQPQAQKEVHEHIAHHLAPYLLGMQPPTLGTSPPTPDPDAASFDRPAPTRDPDAASFDQSAPTRDRPALPFVSARWALDGSLRGDEALVGRSHLAELSALLHSLLLPAAGRARERRLRAKLDALRELVDERRRALRAHEADGDDALQRLGQELVGIKPVALDLDALVAEELAALVAASSRLRLELAEELLALRPPARRPLGGLKLFGLGGATLGGGLLSSQRWELSPADRDFAASWLTTRYRNAALACFARVTQRVDDLFSSRFENARSLAGASVAAEVSEVSSDASNGSTDVQGVSPQAPLPMHRLDRTRVEAEIFSRFTGYLRGALHSERISRQLEPLREADVGVPALARALERLDPDWELELLAPLVRFVREHFVMGRRALERYRSQLWRHHRLRLAGTLELADQLLLLSSRDASLRIDDHILDGRPVQ